MTRAWLFVAIAACTGCSSTKVNEAETPSDSGCADGSVEQTYQSSPIMVGCNGNLTQCGAHALCSPGWHLCTYAEYLARGGANEKATAQRWLAGCVRPRGSATAHCPTEKEGVCGDSCASGAASKVDVRFGCDGSAPGAADQDNLGLVTSNLVLRPGCASAECSYADALPASATNFGATCCQ